MSDHAVGYGHVEEGVEGENVQPVPTPVAMLSTERARFEQHTRVASSMVIESTTMDEQVS